MQIGNYRTYKNKREYKRKLKALEMSAIVYASARIHELIWKHIKPNPRAHDPYARIGWISWKTPLPKYKDNELY